jgi:hypothetical protein
LGQQSVQWLDYTVKVYLSFKKPQNFFQSPISFLILTSKKWEVRSLILARAFRVDIFLDSLKSFFFMFDFYILPFQHVSPRCALFILLFYCMDQWLSMLAVALFWYQGKLSVTISSTFYFTCSLFLVFLSYTLLLL